MHDITIELKCNVCNNIQTLMLTVSDTFAGSPRFVCSGCMVFKPSTFKDQTEEIRLRKLERAKKWYKEHKERHATNQRERRARQRQGIWERKKWQKLPQS